jgi:hypothetical protein
VAAANSWVAAFPEDKEFWLDHEVGRRVCALFDANLVKSKALFGPQRALRPDVDAILTAMVRYGVPEAARLERAIAGELPTGG